MNKTELNFIEKLCHEVRAEHIKECGYQKDYNLSGDCYDVSERLACKLLSHNKIALIVQGLCYGCFHFWVEYKGYILDLSISQFWHLAGKELPDVFIKPIYQCPNHKCEVSENASKIF